MGLDVSLYDSGDSKRVGITTRREEEHLRVATTPSLESTPKRIFLTDPLYGENMNQNAAFGGTELVVHTGTDLTNWSASAVRGTKWTFDSTDQAFSGTKSVKYNNGVVTDLAQFIAPSPISIFSYVAVTMKIYIESNWTAGDGIEFLAMDTSDNTVVGNSVSLSNYVNISNTGVWQSVTIPKADLGLSLQVLDSFAINIRSKLGKSPLMYIDNITLQDSGTVGVFDLVPIDQDVFRLSKLIFSIADDFNISVSGGTAPGIPYDTFLGQPSITNGLNIHVHSKGNDELQFIANCLADVLTYGGTLTDVICDGTNTYVNIELDFETEVMLYATDNDYVSVTLSDDLSGLLLLKVLAVYDKEIQI